MDILQLTEKIGVKHLTEPIHESVVYRNRIRLWFGKNSTTFAFAAVFGWLCALTLVALYNG